MEIILPTQIARLVYGYLIEENCTNAAQLFLETSVHMKECLIVTKKGRQFDTQYKGYTLLDILDILCEVTCIVKSYVEKGKTDSIKESDLLQQLSTLLIPAEVRRLKKFLPSGRDDNLDARQDNINFVNNNLTRNETVQQLTPDIGDENVLESLCRSPHNTSNNVTENYKCNTSHPVGILGESNCPQRFNLEEILPSPLQVTNSSLLNLPTSHGVSGNETLLNNSSTNEIDKQSTIEWCIKEATSNLDQVTNKLAADSSVCQTTPTGQNYVLNTGSPTVTVPPLPLSPLTMKVLNEVLNNSQTPISGIRMHVQGSPAVQFALKPVTPTSEQNCKTSNRPPTSYKLKPQIIQTIPPLLIKSSTPRSAIKNIFLPHTNGIPIIDKPKEQVILMRNVEKPDVNNTMIELPPVVTPQPTESNTEEISPSRKTVMRISGVRTRGGCLKRGGPLQRKVKSYVPKRVNSSENANVVIPTIDLTASTNLSVDPGNQTNKLTPPVKKINIFGENSDSENVNLIVEENKTSEKLNITPRNLRKRISSSVPRRGSHVRALDFKTPTKNSLLNRRAITSPKQSLGSRSPLRKSSKIFRGALFKSPVQTKEKSSDGKAWDEDIRKFTSSNPMDVQESVDLKRNNNVQSKMDRGVEMKSSMGNRKATKKMLGLSDVLGTEETDEDMADKITKEVLSVIGEDNPKQINLIDEDEPVTEKIINIESSEQSVVKNKGLSESDNASEKITSSEYMDVEENNIDDTSSSPDLFETEKRFGISPDPSIMMTPVSKVILEHKRILESELLTPGLPMTPNNLTVNIPTNDAELMKITSPSQESLEASLISVCKRIELENLKKNSAVLEKTDMDRNLNNNGLNISQNSSEEGNFGLDLNLSLSDKDLIDSSKDRLEEEHGEVVETSLGCQLPVVEDVPSSSVPIIPIGIDDSGNKQEDVDVESHELQSVSIEIEQAGQGKAINDEATMINANHDNADLNDCVEEHVNIDCSKLIAQCLEDAEKNLYGLTKSPNSQIKGSKRAKSLKNKQGTKRKSKISNKRSQGKLKNIDRLLSSHSESSSSSPEEENNDDEKIIEGKTSVVVVDGRKSLGLSEKLEANSPPLTRKRRYQESSVLDRESNEIVKMKPSPKRSKIIKESKRVEESSGQRGFEKISGETNKRRFSEKVEVSEVDDDLTDKVVRGNCETATVKEKDRCYERKPSFTKSPVHDHNYTHPVCDENITLTKYLNEYTYTVTLEEENMTTKLKVSPFYTLFEKESSVENRGKHNSRSSSHSDASPRKSAPSRERKEANFKNKNFTPKKSYKRNSEEYNTHKESFHRNGRPSNRQCRYDDIRRRDSSFSAINYKRGNYNRNYYRDHSSTRYRGNRITLKKSFTRRDDRNSESYSRKLYRQEDSSHRSYHKERTEAKRHEEISKKVDIEVRTKFDNDKRSKAYSPTPKDRRLLQRFNVEKEDGELTDESSIGVFTSVHAVGGSRRKVTDERNDTSVGHDTREKLKKVNLDDFLSMVHGTENDDPDTTRH